MPTYNPDDVEKAFAEDPTPRPTPEFRKSDLDIDFDEVDEESDTPVLLTKDPRYYGPDGEPWCRFGAGALHCLNADTCLNEKHRG